MSTEPSAGLPKPTPTPVDPRVRSARTLAGGFIGMLVCGLIGWMIDSAITAEPYAGVRIGIFVGGLFGPIIGGGAGWIGAGLMLSMIVCSAAGVAVSLYFWNPGPDSFVTFLPAGIGGILGAFFGLALGAVLIRSRRQAAQGTET